MWLAQHEQVPHSVVPTMAAVTLILQCRSQSLAERWAFFTPDADNDEPGGSRTIAAPAFHVLIWELFYDTSVHGRCFSEDACQTPWCPSLGDHPRKPPQKLLSIIRGVGSSLEWFRVRECFLEFAKALDQFVNAR